MYDLALPAFLTVNNSGAGNTMRPLTATLLAAQKSASMTPYVKLTARNKQHGVVNLKWERLYSGNEADSSIAMTAAGDGSLVRLRATAASDNRKLYFQRVMDPGPGADFSQWTWFQGQYNVMAAAACSLGAEMSLFQVKSSGEIIRHKSPDNGATFPVTDYPGYAPSGAAAQMAAAYKPDGDLALFFTDGAGLYVIKCLSGIWQTRAAWNKTTGTLAGAAAVYDGDWKLIVSGQDASGNYKVWSLIYGDGGEVTAGTWSDLKTLTTAPAGGSFQYGNVFLDKPDEYRCGFVENYSGTGPYHRPFRTHTLPGTSFPDSRWLEAVPFETESEYGLAMAHTGGYAWLATPSGVWRAGLGEQSFNLSADVLSLKAELLPESGKLTAELRNDRGQYAAPGQGALAVLETGCRIEFCPGYRTPAGNEYSQGLYFEMQGYEHTSSGGQAAFILSAGDGWEALENWTARYQLRWNQPDQLGNPVQEASVKEILTQILARAGTRLEVKRESADIAGFYPDFTIHAEDSGRVAVKRLLSFVPDLLFMEGDTAYLLNPLAEDAAVYSYGTSHAIYEGRYRKEAWQINRVQVEGQGVIREACQWKEIERTGDRLLRAEDLNLTSAEQAQARGEAWLRHTEIAAVSGFIRVPVNCGQQLYNAVEITDSRAGLTAARRRVLGILYTFTPGKGVYEQKLVTGGM